ncbi:MAG: nitroreductase family protein [Thermodesulfobacteriota bacterium]
MGDNTGDRAKGLIEYHNRTKHHPRRYAASPGGLDWSNQPDPFRRYSGTDVLQLPLLASDPALPYGRLFDRAGIEPAPFTVERIAALLELSLGLSAWKSYGGSSWALRMNPSSGNLHPTEGYVVLPPSAAGGVFHYNPYLHALEARASFGEPFWSAVRARLGTDGFLAGLSSIYWRESWKYGERAFRYCNLDLGHAIAALSLSAALLGWRVTCLESLASGDVSTVLGFDRTRWRELEAEDPECLLLVHRADEDPVAGFDPEDVVKPFAALAFSGVPEPLSPGHVDWEVIYRAAELSEKPRTPAPPPGPPASAPPLYAPGPPEAASAAAVIRKRRSGQAYDGAAHMAMVDFLAMLARTSPVAGRAPFDAGFHRSNIHLLVFVHRVTGLAPGLYIFLRGDDRERERALERLKRDLHPGFSWAPAAPERPEVPLHLLEEGDVTGLARSLSCNQEIAGDGAFSMGMLAAFRENIEKAPYMYRRLHWEAGMIGQVLYLESEARGFGGTGIGCFFDDMVHEGLGLADDSFQTIYHFTVGAPLIDGRITTLPPYHHLGRGSPGAGR